MFTGCRLKNKNSLQISEIFNSKCFTTSVTFLIVHYKLDVLGFNGNL